MKKFLLCLFSCLLVCSCQFNKTNDKTNAKDEQKIIDYRNLKTIELGGIEVSTILDIVGKNNISEFIQSKSKDKIRIVYEKNSVSNKDYIKYITYLYNECFGHASILGSINMSDEIGNYQEFYKVTPKSGEVLVITISESLRNSMSVYTISYELIDFDDEIYYTMFIGDNEGEWNTKCAKNEDFVF